MVNIENVVYDNNYNNWVKLNRVKSYTPKGLAKISSDQLPDKYSLLGYPDAFEEIFWVKDWSRLPRTEKRVDDYGNKYTVWDDKGLTYILYKRECFVGDRYSIWDYSLPADKKFTLRGFRSKDSHNLVLTHYNMKYLKSMLNDSSERRLLMASVIPSIPSKWVKLPKPSKIVLGESKGYPTILEYPGCDIVHSLPSIDAVSRYAFNTSEVYYNVQYPRYLYKLDCNCLVTEVDEVLLFPHVKNSLYKNLYKFKSKTDARRHKKSIS